MELSGFTMLAFLWGFCDAQPKATLSCVSLLSLALFGSASLV